MKNENIKLVKENFLLHKELIRLKEYLYEKNKVNYLNIRKLKDNQEEAIFLIQQKDIKIKQVESEANSLRKL